MKITSMPKDTLAEMLRFIAENEKFTRVKEQLGDVFSTAEVRAALREVADALMDEAVVDGSAEASEARADAALSPKTKEVLASLTPAEERKLFAAFGLVSK
jgi:hypothetical protein